MGPNQEFIASRLWHRGLRIGPFGRFSGWYLEQRAPKQQNSSQSSRGKIQYQGVESLNLKKMQEKKLNLRMFLKKLNSFKVTYFGPLFLLSFFVKIYQVILNQTQSNKKIEKSKKKWEGRTQNQRNSIGKRMKNLPKTSRSDRHLCFSHYSNYQYFPHFFFNINTNINIKIPKKFNINIKINILEMQISISISKSIFWICSFQYQNQYQYVQNFDFSKFFKILCHVW